MRKGFTLIELLVVVSIIAILAALLLPVLNQGKIKAKTIACISNHKQMAAAWHMYSDDYSGVVPTDVNDMFPRTNWMPSVMNLDITVGNYWLTLWTYYPLAPYLHNRSYIMKCPTDTMQMLGYDGEYHDRLRSISLNDAWGCAEFFESGWRSYSKITDPYNPSEIVLFIDEHTRSIGDGAFEVLNGLVYDYSIPHGQGSVMSYSDGRAGSHRWKGQQITHPELDVRGYARHNASITDSKSDIEWLWNHFSEKVR